MITNMMRRAMVAWDGSTLSLDFTTGILDPLLTFTRSTSGTYIGSDGLVKTATADTPRFDYDPTAIGTPRGLLIEGSAVNYVQQSAVNSFPSPWSTAGTNLPTTTVAYTGGGFAPDGITRPTRIQFGLNAGGSPSRLLQATSYTTNPTTAAPYTVSVWMKSNTPGTSYSINIYKATGNNLVTVTDSWQRFTVVNTSGTSLVGYIYISNESSSVAADILIWGVQLEAGNGASSYIPTGASTGNRAADVCTIGVDVGTATNFSSWWPLNQSQFTVAWTGDLVRNTSTVQFLWLTRNSVNTSVMRVFANSTSGQPLLGFAGNSIPTSVTVNGIPGATLKTALAAQEGDQAFYANNGTVSSSGVAANTGLAFTSVSMNFNPNADQFMHIKSFKFWPTRLPNAQLQALTT